MTSLNKVDRTSFTNAQRVAYKLITANGQWLSRGQLNRVVPNATARARDLRKAEFGGFKVECMHGAEIGRSPSTTYYRIPANAVSQSKVNTLFGV